MTPLAMIEGSHGKPRTASLMQPLPLSSVAVHAGSCRGAAPSAQHPGM